MFQYRLTAEAKRVLAIFLIGLLIFGLAAISLLFLFRPNHDIHLSKDFVEFGEEVRVTELVESIGDVKISESMRHSSNTIVMDEYEVTFGSIDTSSLGEKMVQAQFSDENIDPVTLHFQVVDTTSPIIHVDKPNETRKYTLNQIENREYLSEFKIQDACTPFSKLDIEGSLVNKEAKTGDQTKIEIVVVDESGNIATASLPIELIDDPNQDKDKNKDDQASSEESKESKDSETSDDSKSSQANKKPAQKPQSNSTSTQTTRPNSNPTPPAVQPAPPTTTPPVQNPEPPVTDNSFDDVPSTPPADQYFWFEDGYDMNNVSSACQAALDRSGWSGACVPIQDEDGIYLGMRLTFN